MSRAPASGRKLDSADAAYVKGMINRHDRQHDIAAYFAVNGGRIGETSTGANFSAVAPASQVSLPPAAPYLVLSATLRAEADALQKDLLKIGAPQSIVDRLNLIIQGMELSKKFRRGK
jgi:hypothetical protein